MTACWQERGCDEEMWSRCPHATASSDGVCVAECCYTRCDRPQHKTTVALDLFLDPTLDRSAACKQTCTFCEYFLVNGPRVLAKTSGKNRVADGLWMGCRLEVHEKIGASYRFGAAGHRLKALDKSGVNHGPKAPSLLDKHKVPDKGGVPSKTIVSRKPEASRDAQ
jgi:hypothetical protein